MGLRELPGQARDLAVRWSHRMPQSMTRAVVTYGERRGAEAAAAMAYYAFLSLFPLLIFLVAAAGVILQDQRVYNQIRIMLADVAPLPSQLLIKTFDEVFQLNTPVGIIALATLLWSGIGFLSALSHHISQAWPDARMRTFLGMRVMGLKMAGVLLLLIIVSVVISLAADLLPKFPVIVPELRALIESPNWRLFSNLVPLFASFLLFLALYKWVPNTHVTWRASFFGALLASIAWQVVTAGFSWYLGSGLATYQVIYGSLGSVVATLFWVYLSNVIAVFGAHLAAAVDATRPPKLAVGPVVSEEKAGNVVS
jgi:membrane protein